MHGLIELALILAGGAFAISAATAAGFLIAPRTALPLSVRFVIGAAGLSVAVFLLLAANAGFRPLFFAGGAVLIVAGCRAGIRSPHLDPLPSLPLFHRWVLIIAALIYFVYALAPEIEPDAVGFHLGLVAEYVRSHGLTRRVGFYELLPQSVEMLFVPAFMIGAHSAAKLVHFAFLLATIPLFRHIARELQVSDGAACTAAVLFILSPVAAVTGTSAYTDLALVCACAAVLYLLLRWNRERATALSTMPLLLGAGLAAGFCYTIKTTFGPIALAGIVYVAFRARRIKPVMLFAAAAAVIAVPWAVRSYLLTGNPFAPLLNAWFPDDGIPPDLDRRLLLVFSVFAPNFSWRMAWPEYTLLGGEQGVLGPAYIFLPLALFALRTKSGRRLLASALIFALPIIPNAGTRFLMPAMVPATIAFCSLVPASLAAGLIAIQAVGALRPVLPLYAIHQGWMLPEFPLRAALRLESRDSYLSRVDPLYGVDEMIVAHTEPDAKVYTLAPLEQAYVPRETLSEWHSALSERLAQNLYLVAQNPIYPATRVAWNIESSNYAAFRITALRDFKLLDTSPVLPPPEVWPLKIFPQGGTWTSQIEPDTPRLDILIDDFEPGSLKLEARAPSGGWFPVVTGIAARGVQVDLRRRATAELLANGYRYVLVPTGPTSFGAIGRDMTSHPAAWGVSLKALEKNEALFQIATAEPPRPIRRLIPSSVAKATVQPSITSEIAAPCDIAMVDDSSSQIAWRRVWKVVQQFGHACNGTLTYTGNAGYSATFRFTGTGVTWIYAAASNGGRAQVWIDNHSVRIVDQYWPCKAQGPGCVAVRWRTQADFGGLRPGPHTIRIKVLHQKSPESQDYGVNVDGFIVH